MPTFQSEFGGRVGVSEGKGGKPHEGGGDDDLALAFSAHVRQALLQHAHLQRASSQHPVGYASAMQDTLPSRALAGQRPTVAASRAQNFVQPQSESQLAVTPGCEVLLGIQNR